MKILHLNYHENSEVRNAANRIHRALLKQNIDSLMLVQNKTSNSDKVISTNNITETFLDKVTFIED